MEQGSGEEEIEKATQELNQLDKQVDSLGKKLKSQVI